MNKAISIILSLHRPSEIHWELIADSEGGLLGAAENKAFSDMMKLRREWNDLDRNIRWQLVSQCETDADAARIYAMQEHKQRVETRRAYLLEVIKFVHSGAHGDVPDCPHESPIGAPSPRNIQAVMRDSRAAKREHAAQLNAFLAAGGTVME